MKKQLFFLAVAALALASCSSENDVVQTPAAQQTVDDGSVVFDSYVQRSTTRSGGTGTMTLETNLSRKLKETGFGVFGYYTDNKEYEGLSIPNFFYNQYVHFDSYWKYEPVKYWPNEYGSSAIADDNDKVSYFAYAPYVDVTPGSGKPSDQTFGIAQLSRNSANGDPYIKYIASFDWTKAVDLLWGVVPTDKTWWEITSGKTQTLKAGMPWLDVERPFEAKTQAAATQRVKFDFKHALSKLNVQIDYDADRETHSETDNAENDLDASTRVYVRSVSFTGFAMKGALNLNNVQPNVPLWKAFDAENELATGDVVVVSDGRKDGKEGVGGAVAPNEPNIFINPALIQTGAWSGDNKGVLNMYQNLFAYPASEKVAEAMRSSVYTIDIESLTDFEEAVGVAKSNGWDYTNDANAAALLSWPVMVIPNGDEITVTIVYDVETVDNNLATKLSDGTTLGSSIENRITKAITFSNSDKNYLEAGKKYTIKLHLGLNSVKFEAAVTGWDEGAEGEAWLPDNEVSYQAPGVYNYNVLAKDTKTAKFKLTGFAPNEDINNEVATPVTSTALANEPANAKGEREISAEKFTFTANTSVLNVISDNAIKFTGITSGKQIVLNLVQAAAQPDGTKSTLTINPTESTGIFVLKDADDTNLGGDVWTGDTRNVQIISATRNGVPMTELSESDNPTIATQFKCSGDRQITLGTAAVGGEKFIFTIKAGDAGEFTVKYAIPAAGTINFSPAYGNYVVGSVPATINVNLVNNGDGTVSYTPQGATWGSFSSPTITISGSPAAGETFKVTATVSNTENYTYLQPEATYTVCVGDVVFSSGFTTTYATTDDQTIIICGLTPNGTLTLQDLTNDDFTTVPSIAPTADENGMATLTFTVASSKDGHFTLKDVGTGHKRQINYNVSVP